MGVGPGIVVEKFMGLDNLTDEVRLPISNGKAWLRQAANVDINDENMISMSNGYELVLSGNIHSFWSNGTVALYVESGAMKSMSALYAPSTVLSGIDASATMNYVDCAGKIYFTNSEIIGYYRAGVASLLTEPTDEFKVAMKPGHLIEYFNARLYVAQDTVLWFSDAVNLGSLDMRKNFFQFPGRITMVKAVTDGLYVSYRKDKYNQKTYFLAGLDPFEFSRREIAGTAAIEGSGTRIPSEDFAGHGIGSIVVWASREGVFVGAPEGVVKNKTWNHYACDDVEYGASILRDDNGFNQYMLAYAIVFDIDGDIEVPALQIEGLMS